MKIEKMMRVPLMLAAMAAGLVFVKPVYAQQDTDPTAFEAAAGQTGAGFNQQVAATTQITAADTSSTAAPQAVDEATMTSAASFDINALMGLVTGAGVMVLLGIVEAMGNRRRTWKPAGTNAWANRAITH